MSSRFLRGVLGAAVAVLLLPACGEETVNNDDVSVVTTLRISVNSKGEEANGPSYEPTLSSDGRFVTFSSTATNLHPDDTDANWDVYLRDTLLGTTELISRADGVSGAKGDGHSGRPVISPDGKMILFITTSTNIHPDFTGPFLPGLYIGILRDLSSHTNTIVARQDGDPGAGVEGNAVQIFPLSVSPSSDFDYFMYWGFPFNIVSRRQGSTWDTLTAPVAPSGSVPTYCLSGDGTFAFLYREAGTPAVGYLTRIDFPSGALTNVLSNSPNDPYYSVRISGDSSTVAFSTLSTILPFPIDTNLHRDIYLFDAANPDMERISLTNVGAEALEGDSDLPDLSWNGRRVVFSSLAPNLVPNDSNGVMDVYLRDRDRKTTIRVSVATYGTQANAMSTSPRISANGRWVAFHSLASNMVGGDTNSVTDIFIRGPLP